MAERTPVIERLQRRLRVAESGCWEWTGSVGSTGYAQIAMWCDDGKWRPRRVHRVAYELLVGPIPDGMDLCHHCDNRICFNPAHLFVGTRSDNMRDAARKGRVRNMHSGRTHCPRGHEFTLENTIWNGAGNRACATCKAENYRQVTLPRRKERYATDDAYRRQILQRQAEVRRAQRQAQRKAQPPRPCPQCSEPILGKVTARFCSDNCRIRAWRAEHPRRTA